MHYLLEKFNTVLGNYHVMNHELTRIDDANYILIVTELPVELDAKFVSLRYNGEEVFIPFKNEKKELGLKCHLSREDYAGKINEIDATIRRYLRE